MLWNLLEHLMRPLGQLFLASASGAPKVKPWHSMYPVQVGLGAAPLLSWGWRFLGLPMVAAYPAT